MLVQYKKGCTRQQDPFSNKSLIFFSVSFLVAIVLLIENLQPFLYSLHPKKVLRFII
jgi:hypothetical protein